MMKIAKLNELYDEAEACDREIFSEMRSNIRLVAGDHYPKKNSRFLDRLRESKQVSEDQKLRLTKNHIQKICKGYHNAIISHSPSTFIGPHNEKELKDQKAAELNNSVWEDMKKRYDLKRKISNMAKDYVEIGECAMKIFYDPFAGKLVGYEAKMGIGPDGEMAPEMDENGELQNSGRPMFSGAMCFERIHGFNLLRSPSAKTMDESPYLIYRKMVPQKELLIMVGDDEEKQKMVQQSSQDVFRVFDGATGNYSDVKGMCMVREFYFRVSQEHPLGAWSITTENGILFGDEGEGLPFGVFPIEYEGFEEIQTTPRHRSIIKVLRPYQAEINRTASKIAETQITLGDDKLTIQSGTKLQQGATLPGVRAIQYTGASPGLIPGRSGEQYVPYMTSQITEMYQVANYFEEAENITGTSDPMLVIFQSMVNRKKFLPYAQKFESFVVRLTEKGLKLKKGYCNPEELIPIIGKAEAVNIPEFKSTEDISYQIKVEPMSDDVHTQMGKQIVFQNILQYVGSSLQKEDIGLLIRQMPWLTKDSAFADLTLDYDCATNDILALDRGQFRPAHADDNHTYMIKRLTSRMKMSDFEMLSPQIQQMYQARRKQHEGIKADQIKKIQAAKDGFIPTTGYLVTVDFYINTEGKTSKAKVPYDALGWLMKKLSDQGMAQQDLEKMNQGALSEIAQMLIGPGESMGNGMPDPSMGGGYGGSMMGRDINGSRN